MKKLLVFILISIFSTSVHAQTFGEWFRQKATQKKYLLQQIAALQVYIGYAQKGYSIAHDGLNFIGDLKKGDLNLHADYFNSLKAVNPSIKKYSRVADIISLQLKIVSVYKNAFRQVQKSKAFNGDELKYMNAVFNNLIDACTGTIDELTTIITNDQLQMKDDERLERIDGLYNDMQSKYSFVKGFADEAKVLAVSRLKEQNDVETSRTINGIKD